MGEDLLRQVPLFQRGGSGFVAMLGLGLKPQTFLKGDYLQKEGALLNMYFQHQGDVRPTVLSPC